MNDLSDKFDALVRCLRQQGLDEPADRLHEMLHKTAWTTSSELIGSVDLAIRKMRKRYGGELSPESRRMVLVCLASIKGNWPEALWLRLTDMFRW